MKYEENNGIINFEYSDVNRSLKETIYLKPTMTAKLQVSRDVINRILSLQISDKDATLHSKSIPLKRVKQITRKTFYELFGTPDSFDYNIYGINKKLDFIFGAPRINRCFRWMYTHVKRISGKPTKSKQYTGKKDELRRYLEKRDLSLFARKRNVFDIPISKSSDGGSANFQFQTIHDSQNSHDVEDKKRQKIIATDIDLCSPYRLGTIGTYAHEITHFLVDRNRNNMKNYTNEEVMSIFMEKVVLHKLLGKLEVNSPEYISVKDAIDDYELYRYKDTKVGLSRIIQDCDYIKKYSMLPTYNKETHFWPIHSPIIHSIGSLLAEKLFDKYENSSETEKEKMLSCVGKIFSNQMTIEDFLSQENCSEITLTDADRYNQKISDIYDKTISFDDDER